MSLALYMDVHVPAAVTTALINRGIDVLTSQKDGTTELEDPMLLNRAGHLKRVLVSQDKGFIREAAIRVRQKREFSGIVYAPQQGLSYATFISDLEIIAKVYEPSEMRNHVEFLPLREP